MILHRLLYLLIFLSCFSSTTLFSQELTRTIQEIDSMVLRINQTCISGGITDYSFHKKGHKKKTIGGGADWFYTDSSGKQLLKVVRETSLTSETFETFYFHRDSLILLDRINYRYEGDRKITSWQQKAYFRSDNLLSTQLDTHIPLNTERILATAREFFQHGKIWRRTF